VSPVRSFAYFVCLTSLLPAAFVRLRGPIRHVQGRWTGISSASAGSRCFVISAHRRRGTSTNCMQLACRHCCRRRRSRALRSKGLSQHSAVSSWVSPSLKRTWKLDMDPNPGLSQYSGVSSRVSPSLKRTWNLDMDPNPGMHRMAKQQRCHSAAPTGAPPPHALSAILLRSSLAIAPFPQLAQWSFRPLLASPAQTTYMVASSTTDVLVPSTNQPPCPLFGRKAWRGEE
jgi:hypothetical protein